VSPIIRKPPVDRSPDSFSQLIDNLRLVVVPTRPSRPANLPAYHARPTDLHDFAA
jgi:hypothetical protein